MLTAENLRTELLELWQAGEFPAESILIVTHNIAEAVTFADRVIVLGTNPGRIRAELANGLKRPRDRRSDDFGALLVRCHVTYRVSRARRGHCATDGTARHLRMWYRAVRSRRSEPAV